MASDQPQSNMNRSNFPNPGTGADSTSIPSYLFPTSPSTDTFMPNPANPVHNFSSMSYFPMAAGMHSQQTNLPQFRQACHSDSEAYHHSNSQCPNTRMIDSHKPQLDEPFDQMSRGESDTLWSVVMPSRIFPQQQSQGQGGPSCSQKSQQTKSGSSNRRINDARYNGKQKEKKIFASLLVSVLEGSEIWKDLVYLYYQEREASTEFTKWQVPPKPPTSSNIQQIHPAISASEPSYPKINIETLKARLNSCVRNNCIEVSTRFPQQVNASETRNDIVGPYRMIASRSGGIASSSAISEIHADSQAGTSTFKADELFMEINAPDRKRNVKFSDFPGLDGKRVQVPTYSFLIPKSLQSTVEKIIKSHGDITEKSKMNDVIIESAFILFCASIKEMNDLQQIEEVTEEKILKWNDTIMDALQIKFEVNFAKKFLMDVIVRTYVAQLERKELKLKVSKLKNMIDAAEERDRTCNNVVEEFNGKSDSKGLFKYCT